MTNLRWQPCFQLLVLAFATGACHTARRGSAPTAPAAPAAPSPAATPAPPAVPPSEGPAGPPPAPLLEATASAEPAEGSAEAGLDDESAAEGIQKEALDLCQSAAEMLRKGERDRAIQTVDLAYRRMLSLPDNGDGGFLQTKDDVRQLIARLLQEAYAAGSVASSPSWDLGMPIVDNQHVRREIKSFTTVERDHFLEAYRRSGRYRPMILAKLEAAHLPSQLAWLPLVESWFKVRALSRAGAVGLWQFIASTGLRYGMTRDGWVDQRMDPDKATEAAIAFLTHLHGLFGDWPKALAAYNCGEGRVRKLQGRSGDQYQDFWDLYEQLPQETRRYVPRFIAALQIIQDPEHYGLTLPQPDSPAEDVSTIRTSRSVSLSQLEQALGLAGGILSELNPELRYAATPKGDYDLRVPAELAEAALSKIAQLAEWSPPRPAFIAHRVLSGQTLGSIARLYGTTVGAIQRANGLGSAHRLRVGRRLRIPLPASRR